MKSKIQIFAVVIFLLLVGVVLVLVQKNQFADKDLNQLSYLNEKYGLAEVSALAEKESTKSYTAFFEADMLKANLLESKKDLPTKEIILKLSDSSTEMENLFLLSFKTPQQVQHIVEDYSQAQLVQYAEENFSIELAEEIPDNATSQPKALEGETSNNSITVAVIDSGIDSSHEFFKDKLVDGWDFIEDTSVISDEIGHGTHVSGIILQNSSTAKIMPIKFTNGKKGKMNSLVKAIKFAADNEAKIINLSLGLKNESKVLDEALAYAQKRNIIIVAAAGNYNSDAKYYPAAAKDVIAVAALDKKDQKLYQSNYGNWIDFSALGQDVYSTSLNNNYTYRTGTSQAAPLITAKLSDILSRLTQEYSFAEIYEQLAKKSLSIDGDFKDLLGKKVL